jgi:hypothetical protein
MRNIISSTLLIALLGAIAWSYYDYQNKQQMITDMIQKAEEQARADHQAHYESQLRSEARSKRLDQLRTELTQCQTDAEKSKNNFLNANQRADPRHSGEFTVSRSIIETAEKLVADEKAKCYQIFEAKLRGQ